MEEFALGLSRGLRRSRRRSVTCGAIVALATATIVAPAVGASGAAHRKGAAEGGTLTVAAPLYPSTMDPATGQNAFNQYYDLAYSPLIYWNSKGQYVPDLAISWAIGARNESITFNLRAGVRFSDGSPLNAAAVKTWIEHEMKVPGGAALSYLAALKSIKVEGPLKLTVFFSKPTPQLPAVFSQDLEMGMVGSPKAVKANDLKTSTDGAGEYVLDKAATVFGSTYTFLPNKYYWNPSAIHWKKVVIRYIESPTTTLQAMQSGQVQVAVQQQVNSIPAARSDGFNVTKPYQAFDGLLFLDRTGKLVPALGKLKVRQAINDALDRNAINKAVYAGQGTPNDELALPGDDGYLPALAHYYTYNLVKARRLLAQAGYGHGFTLPVLSASGFNTLVDAIAGELSKIGITVTPITAPSAGAFYGMLASGKYPASALDFGGLPSYYLYKLLLGPGATQWNPLKTPSSFLAAQYEKLLTTTPSEAKPFAQAMVRYATVNAWAAVTDSTPLTAFSVKGVGGFAASPGRPLWYLPDVQPVR